MRRAIFVLLVACASPPRAEQAIQDPPRGTRPEDTTAQIFAALSRIETNDEARVAIAADYVSLTCGTAHRFSDPTAAANARILRGVPDDWDIAISTDGAMAWAFGTTTSLTKTGAAAPHPSYLEILEHRGEAWVLVAGAESYASRDTSPCTDAAPEPVFSIGTTEIDTPLVADTPRIGVCSTAGEDETFATAPVPLQHVVASRDGAMAWAIGAVDGAPILDVVEHGERGWVLAARIWSPSRAVEEERCSKRGRVVVSDSSVEILDVMSFDKNDDQIDAKARKLADAVISTLQGNPDIDLVRFVTHATSDETDPVGLSERRGLNLRTYFVDHGIPLDHLEIEFTGDGDPPDAPKSEDESEEAYLTRSRRIEFVIGHRVRDH